MEIETFHWPIGLQPIVSKQQIVAQCVYLYNGGLRSSIVLLTLHSKLNHSL
jgi:hypothetical protein